MGKGRTESVFYGSPSVVPMKANKTGVYHIEVEFEEIKGVPAKDRIDDVTLEPIGYLGEDTFNLDFLPVVVAGTEVQDIPKPNNG